jgi:hypothetical protein
VFLGFLIIGVVLSAGGMYLTRRPVMAPTLLRPCLWPAATEVVEEDSGDDGLEQLTCPRPRTWHIMKDEELLWRARGGYPFWRMPKVAFMFLARPAAAGAALGALLPRP